MTPQQQMERVERLVNAYKLTEQYQHDPAKRWEMIGKLCPWLLRIAMIAASALAAAIALAKINEPPMADSISERFP